MDIGLRTDLGVGTEAFIVFFNGQNIDLLAGSMQDPWDVA
jgi:hypothetical protein